MGKIVILIPLIGLGALALFSGDPAFADKLFGFLGKLSLPAGSVFVLWLGYVIVTARPRTLVIGREGSVEEVGKYLSPRITAASVIGERGEFEVVSSHSEHLIREMKLPPGSEISIVVPNACYRVQFATQVKKTSDHYGARVGEGGSSRIEHIHTTQAETSRWEVEEWARANGFRGRIETG